MLIDVDRLEDEVKPQIKNARKYLELGKNSINSINIPNDFSYRTRLRNIPQSILEIDGRVNSIDKWLDRIINNLKNVENKNENVMGNLINAIPTVLVGGVDAVAGFNLFAFGTE